jgi:biotin carboxyl carrier protein
MLAYLVKEGDWLKAGQPLCVVESMKMEVKISVPDEFDGTCVKSLVCTVRGETKQGDLVLPGDLLLEVDDSTSKVWK